MVASTVSTFEKAQLTFARVARSWNVSLVAPGIFACTLSWIARIAGPRSSRPMVTSAEVVTDSTVKPWMPEMLAVRG